MGIINPKALGIRSGSSVGLHSCRPDQLYGWWGIEPVRFGRMVSLAKAANLEALRAETRAAGATKQGEPLYELTSDGLAIVSIAGPTTKYPTSFQSLLGGTSTLRVREALRAAVRDPDVIGIMTVIDSPGGTVGGTAELAGAIRKAAVRKPLGVFVDDLMASAALWAGSGGRWILAKVNAEIGSRACTR